MKTKILAKVLAALLVAANLLCVTACKDTSWVVKSGDSTISAGVYLGYLVDAYYSAAYLVEDQQTDMFKQEIDGVKADEYIKNTALNSCKNYIVTERLFNEYKLTLSDEKNKELSKELENVWANVSSIYEENGCGKQSLLKIITAEEKYNAVFEHYYGKDGKEPLSEKEKIEYFEKNYAKIKYIEVNYSNHYDGVTTASTATDKQKQELKALAEKYLERLNNGESIDKLIAEEKAFSTDEEKGDEATEIKEVDPTFVEKDTSDDPDAFNKKIFDTKFNTPTLAENDTYGYYIFVRYETDSSSKDYTDRASSILSSMKSEEFDKIIEKEIKNVKVTENKAAINRFKPQNIVIAQ